MQIGNAHYNCSCVRYILSENNSLWLIIGLAAGCTIILIIIIIIIVVVMCRRRRSKAKEERSEERHTYDDIRARSIELKEDERNYCTIPAATKAECVDNAYSCLGPVARDENRQYTALVLPKANTNTARYESPYAEIDENRYTALR